MGCGESKQVAKDKTVKVVLSKADIEKLSRSERFERAIPIQFIGVEQFIEALRNIHHD